MPALAAPVLADKVASATELLALQARARPDAIAMAESDGRLGQGLGKPRTLSFGEMASKVDEIAGLFSGLGLVPGELVAFQLPNIAEQQMLLLGARRAGLRVSILPILWRRGEIARAFASAPPRAIVTVSRFAGHDHALTMCELAAELRSVRHVLGVGNPVPDGVTALDPLFDGEPFLSGGSGDGSDNQARDSLITWTADADSDVTPVFHTEAALIALGAMAARALRLDGDDRLLCPYPATGPLGLGLLIAALTAGATLMPHVPFDYPGFVDQIARGATHVLAPHAVLDALAADGLLGRGANLDAVVCVWPGPRQVYPRLRHEAIACPIFDMHAMGAVSFSIRQRHRDDDPASLPLGEIAAAGEAATAVETRVRGAVRNGGDGHALIGELYVRGSAVSPQDEAGTDLVNTHVRCSVDERRPGSLRCQRDPRVIHHGGVAICARELDALYAECPGLSDAAAFALADDILGERLFAAVVPLQGCAPSLETLRAHLRSRDVAPYKIPDGVVPVKEIHRGADGAVLRDRLWKSAMQPRGPRPQSPPAF